MLLLPSNMVFSKVRSWNDVSECETNNNNNNNNTVKNDILRTPPRCTFVDLFNFIFYLLSYLCKSEKKREWNNSVDWNANNGSFFGVSNLQICIDIWFPWNFVFFFTFIFIFLILSLSMPHTPFIFRLFFRQMVFWFLQKKYHFIPYFVSQKKYIHFSTSRSIPSSSSSRCVRVCRMHCEIDALKKCNNKKKYKRNAKSLMLFRDA
jgi:hypothetical protein